MKVQQLLWSESKGWKSLDTHGVAGDNVQLVLVFGGVEQLKRSDAFKEIKGRFPNAHYCGCTTAGEIQESSVYDQSVTLTAVSFDSTTIKATPPIDVSGDSSYDSGVNLVNSLPHDGLRHIFLLTDGLNTNGTDLAKGINSALPAGVTVTGGFAADGTTVQKPYIWCDSEPTLSAVVAIGFYGDNLKVGLSVTHGWDPFGPDRLVTKSDRNVVHELDGEPILSLYKRYLGDQAAQLPGIGFSYPMQITNNDTNERVVRTLIGINEENDSMIFAGDVPEMCTARLMFGNPEHLIDSAFLAANESLAGIDSSEVQLSILVSCLGRRPVLKQRIEEEVEAVSDIFGANAALTGFYSHGEIAPFSNTGKIVLHNQTLTLTCFSEAA